MTGIPSLRYKQIEPVLEMTQFPGDIDQWTQIGEPRNAKIQNNEIALQPELIGAIGGLYRQFPLDSHTDGPDKRVLRVTGHIERTADDPTALNLTMDQSTIVALDFALDDDGGRKVHILLDITHAQRVTKIDSVIPVPNPVKAVSLGFLHREAADSAIATDFEIESLLQRDSYRWSLVFVLVLGCILLLQILKIVFSHFSAFRLLSLLAGAGILFTLLLPEMQALVSNGYQQAQQTLLGSALPISLDIFSIGHVVSFTVIAILSWSYAASFQQAKIITCVQIVLFTIASEGAQQHISGRTASIADLGYNLLGLFIGTLVYLLFTSISMSGKTKPDQLDKK